MAVKIIALFGLFSLYSTIFSSSEKTQHDSQNPLFALSSLEAALKLTAIDRSLKDLTDKVELMYQLLLAQQNSPGESVDNKSDSSPIFKEPSASSSPHSSPSFATIPAIVNASPHSIAKYHSPKAVTSQTMVSEIDLISQRNDANASTPLIPARVGTPRGSNSRTSSAFHRHRRQGRKK